MRAETEDFFARLEQEITDDGYPQLLLNIKRRGSCFKGFDSWTDVVAFLHTGKPADPRKDGILRSLLASLAKGRDPRWWTLLLTAFRPGLLRIYLKKATWDPDPDELFENLLCVFLQAVRRIDLAQRPRHLARKLMNDTVRHLHEEYCRIWDRSQGVLMSPSELDKLPSLRAGIEFPEIFLREFREREIARFRKHLEAGNITEPGYLVLVATRVYRLKLTQYARESGLKFPTARKQRQRAEAAIRTAESGNLVPHFRADPPFRSLGGKESDSKGAE